jgi:hypothetical protein
MKRFTRLLTTVAFLLLGTANTWSQNVSSYTFSSSSGSYTPIVGGTNYPSTTGGVLDDNSYSNLSIGFTFSYAGTNYTAFGINANGWIQMGSGTVSSTYTPVSGTANNMVSAFGVDLIGRQHFVVNRTSGSPTLTVTSGNTSNLVAGDVLTGTGIVTGSTVVSVTATTITMSANATSTGTGSHCRAHPPSCGIRYETIGSAPNRQLVVQWTSFSRYSTSASAGDKLDFQIILEETTNNVYVVYNAATPTGTASILPQVGLRGASSADFNNRTTTTNWAATSAGGSNLATCTYNNTVSPGAGLTFTWTAPAPPSCGVPTTLGAIPGGTTADLSWAAPVIGTPGSYDWEVRTTGAGGSGPSGLAASGNVLAPTVAATATGLAAATSYNLYVRTNCAGGAGSSTWAGPFAFSTTLDCSTAISLSCGTSVNSTNLAVAGGVYNITACGFSTPGKERLYTFTPTQSGTHQLQVTNVNGGTVYIDYFFKDAAGGCGPTGWTCIDDINAVTTATIPGLVAGTEYYILLDPESATGTANHNFQINCPPTNNECADAISVTTNPGTSCDVTTAGSSVLATQSQAGCAGTADDDVWFSFVADVSTQVINVTPAASGGMSNVVFEVFSGTCGSLTSLACVDATTGTAAEQTTLNALTPGTTYYIRVHSNGNATGQGAFTVCVRQENTCIDPTALASSNITATGVDLAWTENGTATVWDIYRSATATPAPISSTTPTYNNVSNPYSVTGLTAATTYYFWVRADCGSGTSNWTGPITVTTLISNDEPATPILLSVGAGCTGAPYTNVGATLGSGEPYPSCSGTAVTPVWFSFDAPTSGAVRVTTELGTPTFIDSKVAIFDQALNIISCDDDGGAGSGFGGIGFGFLSVVYAFNLDPGATYLIAVDKYDSFTSSGTFCIAVDAIAPSMLSTGGCGSSYQTPVSNGNTTYNGWVPLTDNSAKLVAMVRNPAGGSVSSYAVLQNINSGAVRQSGFHYLDRNYLINNSAATNVEVLLPFLSSEMTALTAADPLATLSSVGVTRVNTTTCTANYGGNPSNTTFIAQESNGSANGVDHITFTTPAFSNFYVNATAALPIELTKFTGKTMASSNMIEWATAIEENVSAHIIERSADGLKWTEIGRQASKGTANASYQLEDRAPLAQAYYRLRTVDFDGFEQKSDVILLTRRDKQFGVVGVFPNPTSGDANIQFAVPAEGKVTLRVADLTGRIVLEQAFDATNGINTQTLSLSRLTAGTYTVTVINDGSVSEPKRIVKQ